MIARIRRIMPSINVGIQVPPDSFLKEMDPTINEIASERRPIPQKIRTRISETLKVHEVK